MSGGYTGKMLFIDLKKQKTTIKKTNLKDAELFIGAKGLGAKILYDNLPQGTEALSAENILLFTTGPLTATKVQTSGRGTVVTKSPQTNLFLDSHFGGSFAAEIKKAGWDIIIVKGKSKHPIYLVIKDDTIEFKDAVSIWGEQCLATHNLMQKIEGKSKTAVIGPAGENLVKFSAITIDGHRHAGRGGAGAVMGSKNLKAIVLKGSKKIPIHDKEKFNAKAKETLKKIQENSFVPMRRKYGTPYWVKPVNDWGLIPTQNFKEGYFEQGDSLSAETMQDRIVDGSGACFNCVIACWNKSSIKSGPHKNVSLVGPEYETIALMGTNLKLQTIEEVAYLNNICNELGMDTISLGGVLGFAVEAFEQNALSLEDLAGLSIDWGKTKEFSKLIHDIAFRNSKAGDILAEGVKKASEKLGKNTKEYAAHAKGLEIPGYDPRGSFGMGLAYATSDRGGCHQRAWTVTTELNNPEYDRFSFKKKAQLVKQMQDDRAAFFSLVLCDFAPISEEDCVSLLNTATGFSHTVKSYLTAGERIWNLIRLFNIREGLDPADDTISPRFFNDSFSKGGSKDHALSKKAFKESLLEYYNLRGWDKKGVPTSKKLIELGLESYKK